MFCCGGHSKKDQEDLERFVVSIPFFDQLDAGKIKTLAQFFKRGVYKRGQVICPVGQKIDSFYIIARGSVSFGPAGADRSDKEEKDSNNTVLLVSSQGFALICGHWFRHYSVSLVIICTRTWPFRLLRHCLPLASPGFSSATPLALAMHAFVHVCLSMSTAPLPHTRCIVWHVLSILL